jgi:hypothetical protein
MNIETITTGIIVDHGMSLEDMIAAGKYDWVNPNITPKSFPITTTGIVQFEPKIFHFDRYISSEDAVAAIKTDDPQNPWEPAKIEGLLAYGEKHPEEQRRYPIIGLGSVAEIDGGRGVPCLYGNDAGRGLDFGWFGLDWGDDCRFLAVRELPSAS